jgi:hypothetical protein
MHQLAHKEQCQAPYSLNFAPGVGRTDGEGIERIWAAINSAAPSTAEMGSGSRADTLDDILHFHNFKKYVGLGKSYFELSMIHSNAATPR